MRLLVSVRSVDEVTAAIAGGADIIDAKEPGRGSLGPVDEATLRAIAEAVPDRTPLSIALGDLSDPGRVTRDIDGIAPRPRELYVKVGVAGVKDFRAARDALRDMSETARTGRQRAGLVLVAYADHDRADALPPEAIMALAGEVGCRGVLLDTWLKDGHHLFDWISPSALRTWLDGARQRGLLNAVAGSLAGRSFRDATGLQPDIVGVRGAACDGGRDGVVSEARVRELADVMYQARRASEAVV